MMTDQDLTTAQNKLQQQQQRLQEEAHATTLGEILGASAEAMSQRITGKTLLDWDNIFNERRRKGARSGHFRGGVMLMQMTEAEQMKAAPTAGNEIESYCRQYGLTDDDLVMVTGVSVFSVVENRKRAGLPFPSVPVRKDVNTKTLNVLMVSPTKFPG